MSDTQTHPLKRFLLWLSGAPAELSLAAPALATTSELVAPSSAQASAPEPVEPAVATTIDSATAISPQPAASPGTDALVAPAVAASVEAAVAGEDVVRMNGLPAATAEILNDATGYGVVVVPAVVSEGSSYWRAVLVHHLTPDENHANHHLFLDALDEQGDRIAGARGRVTWEGGEQMVTVDKPANEPGTNFPMWKWQVCTVEMLDLPSDRVTGLHTGHPDEPPGMGNTLFHHSFAVHFQRAIKDAQPGPGPQQPSGSVISGTVSGATGEKFIERYFLFGASSSARTAVYLDLARSYLLAHQPTFGFRAEDAMHAQRVVLMGAVEDIPQATEDALRQAGCQVQRISGTPQQIQDGLRQLDTGGHQIFLPTTPMDTGHGQ